MSSSGQPIQINHQWFEPDYFVAGKTTGYFSKTDFHKYVYNFLVEWYNKVGFINATTSGSTGRPGHIKLSKQSVFASALKTCTFFKLNAKTTALLCLPVDYIAGKLMLVRAIASGLNLIIEEPSALPLHSVNDSIDFTAITPMQLKNLIKADKELNKAKVILVGGASVDYTTLELLKDLKPRFYQSYGMTETATHVAIRPINHTEIVQPYSAIPGVSFSTDQRDCLIINAPHISNDPIYTNDIVKLIDEQHFYWKGRLDFVINTGAIKVYPEEIEKKLSKKISEPFFIGSMKDETLGEKVVIYIEEGSSLNKTALSAIFDNTLNAYEKPREIIKVKKIRFSTNGKIIREISH